MVHVNFTTVDYINTFNKLKILYPIIIIKILFIFSLIFLFFIIFSNNIYNKSKHYLINYKFYKRKNYIIDNLIYKKRKIHNKQNFKGKKLKF